VQAAAFPWIKLNRQLQKFALLGITAELQQYHSHHHMQKCSEMSEDETD
jgi:hypothetical protein